MSRFIPVEPEKWGQMVKAWADNARLETEVERLKAELFKLVATDNEEICRLQDEVERLRKAGDALASSVQFREELDKDYEGDTLVHPSVKAWRDAQATR